MEKGAKIESKDHQGSTPLICAAIYGHCEVVEILLAKGVNIKSKGDEESTPLHCAAMNGHLEVVKLLLAKGGIRNAPPRMEILLLIMLLEVNTWIL